MKMALIDFILHIDSYLQIIVSQYSTLTYWILFLIVFLETGVVVTPFLPWDSLLFASWALAATGVLNIEILLVLLFVAAVLGDTVNYFIWKFIGPKVFRKEWSIFFNKNHLLRAQQFYNKYWGITIIIARFIPIVRTFAPFVAWIWTMSYGRFFSYNIIGAAIWCGSLLLLGYFFGNLPIVKDHFGEFVLAIIFISVLPIIKEILVYIWSKIRKKA